jgi:hypothetical protein
MLVTDPGPLTVRDRRAVLRTKVALTVRGPSTATKHLGALPTQPPPQWSNPKKLSGVALRETTAPRR